MALHTSPCQCRPHDPEITQLPAQRRSSAINERWIQVEVSGLQQPRGTEGPDRDHFRHVERSELPDGDFQESADYGPRNRAKDDPSKGTQECCHPATLGLRSPRAREHETDRPEAENEDCREA